MTSGAFKRRKRKLLSLLPVLGRKRPEKSGDLPSPVVADPDRHGLALVAIVKDEERYLDEWLDFHMMLGARSAYVYDNGSTDRTCAVLRESRWADRVTIVPWRNFDAAIRMQNAAYSHALANFGSRHRWMAFIDIDEFVVPKQAADLNEALAAFEDLPALSLPWHNFGPSGHAARPEGLVIENYLERAEFPPRAGTISLLHYKTIVDPARVARVKTHRVELIGEGEVMYNDRRERFSYHDRMDTRHATAEMLQLNHYFTRSEEEMREKIAKGRVSKNGRATNAELLTQQVEKLLRHTTRDETILRFVPALKASREQR